MSEMDGKSFDESQYFHIAKSDYYRLVRSAGIDLDEIPDVIDQEFTSAVVDAVENMRTTIEYDQQDAEPKKQVSKSEKKMIKKAKSLESELKLSLNKLEDVTSIRSKYLKIAEKLRREKESKTVLEEFITSQNKKLKILSDHIEKLMKAIKVENNNKMKALEQVNHLQKDIAIVNSKLDKQIQLTSTQHRFIEEIKEGSRVLEDQLRLMDEKYLELRNKLDWARSHFKQQIDRQKQLIKELRLKYSQSFNGNLLDSVKLRPISNDTSIHQREILLSKSYSKLKNSYDNNGQMDSAIFSSKENSNQLDSTSNVLKRSSSSPKNLIRKSFSEMEGRNEGFNKRPQSALSPTKQRNKTAPVRPRTANVLGLTSSYTKDAFKNFGAVNEDKVMGKIKYKHRRATASEWTDERLKYLAAG